MKTRYKHIHFVEQPMMQCWECVANRGNDQLGLIELHGAWGRVTFMPNTSTEFSSDCLADVVHFIGQLEKGQHE